MELRQTKSLRMFDDNNGRIWRVNADFNHGGCDEDIKLSGLEPQANGLFVLRAQPSVKKTDSVAKHRRELAVPVLNRGEIYEFAILD